LNNQVNGTGNFIGGGQDNVTSGPDAVVAGGSGNTATGSAAIGGGSGNTAASFSVIPGGLGNSAPGRQAFAAGTSANAQADGTFVWADSVAQPPLTAAVANSFVARATGGFWFGRAGDLKGPPSAATGHLIDTSIGCFLDATGWTCPNSDRTLKENIRAVEPSEILARLAELPIDRWKYSSDPDHADHVGPMAQDFRAVFGLGRDDRSIASIDEGGVALAAIQALHQLAITESNLRARDAEQIRALREDVAARQEQIVALTRQVSAQESRLAAVEEHLAQLATDR
jgi:hypothetical protein